VLVCRGSAARAHSPRAALPGTPSAAEAVKLYVRTGWQTAKLHGSLQGGAWKDIQLNKVRVVLTWVVGLQWLLAALRVTANPMHLQVTSAPGKWVTANPMHRVTANPMHLQVTSAPGKWMEATIRPPPSSSSSSSSSSNGSATPLLEFVVTDGGSQWDKPAAGACWCAGSCVGRSALACLRSHTTATRRPLSLSLPLSPPCRRQLHHHRAGHVHGAARHAGAAASHGAARHAGERSGRHHGRGRRGDGSVQAVLGG
jgi:hypothetical protein